METSRAPVHAGVYRARRPERTVLYHALAHHFERFLLAYEERFEPTRGYLRRCVEPTVHRYLRSTGQCESKTGKELPGWTATGASTPMPPGPSGEA